MNATRILGISAGFGRKSFWAGSVLALLGLASVANAQTIVTVDGVYNPFLAGQPAGKRCCKGDSAPDESPVLALENVTDGEKFTFSSTGRVNHEIGDTKYGPEGDTGNRFSLKPDEGTGISGPKGIFISALVGVFTTDSVPVDPAPEQIDGKLNNPQYGPGLNQIFFIGDGKYTKKSGKNGVQIFVAPVGATRLYLGVADGYGWANNQGHFTTTINVLTERPKSGLTN